MGGLVRNVTVTPLAQNQLFVMNIVVNANVRKTLSDVDVTNVLQHFMVLDKMVAHVSFVMIKVENILTGKLDSIPSPSQSVKIQIMGGKVCLRCKGKTLLGVVKELLKTNSMSTSPSNVLPYYLK